jgi:hypothetical protein
MVVTTKMYHAMLKESEFEKINLEMPKKVLVQ